MADPVRTPRLAPEQRRRQLLDAALAVAAAEGMAGMTVEAVAREAGVTRPVVYDQFGDLDGLVLALLDREEAVALAPLEWIAAAATDGVDPDGFLVDGLRSFLAAVAAAPRTWRLVLMPADGGSVPVRERIGRRRDDVTAAIEGLLGWGLAARGGPANLDTGLLARQLVAIGEEAARLVLTHPRRYSPARLTDAIATLIGLLPRRTTPASADGTARAAAEDWSRSPAPGPVAAATAPGGDVGGAAGPGAAVASADGAAPPAVAPGPVRVPMARRRAQLLDEALALIGEQGFDALSVDALARRAGVNRVIVYRAYANLGVLLLALLRREGAAIDTQLDALLPAAGDRRCADRLLLDSLGAFLDAVVARPRTWRLALLKPEGAPVTLQKLVARRRTQLARRLSPLVASGLRDLPGAAADVDVEVLTRLLLTDAEELGRVVLEDPRRRDRVVAEMAVLLGSLGWRAD